MKQDESKINRSIKIYPLFASFTGDLIFFVPIDTLFLTLVKGLNASQITAMTMISLIMCIVFQKVILFIVKKIGNVNSLRLGASMLLIASLILTFGKSFVAMLLYKTTHELAVMFLNMDEIILKNNLKALNRKDDYFKIRNKSKIVYATITLFTALVAGQMFNINNYLPMYLSIIIYIFVLGTAFLYYEAKGNNELEIKKDNKKLKITSLMFYVILSNAVFYSIIKMGQNNSKLFMQYDFQKFLSVEMVTYYITIIVFISRIVRLIGNVIFGKLYKRIKDKMSVILTICLALSFLLLITGHFIESNFACKVTIMSLGFFLILAIRDSFQTYIEDVALSISNKQEQQTIIIKIEVYRRLGTLLLSTIFTLILLKYELIVIEMILLILSVIEIYINKRLCDKITK
jgi:membrane protein